MGQRFSLKAVDLPQDMVDYAFEVTDEAFSK